MAPAYVLTASSNTLCPTITASPERIVTTSKNMKKAEYTGQRLGALVNHALRPKSPVFTLLLGQAATPPPVEDVRRSFCTSYTRACGHCRSGQHRRFQKRWQLTRSSNPMNSVGLWHSRAPKLQEPTETCRFFHTPLVSPSSCVWA